MRIDRIAARTWELSSTTKIRMMRRKEPNLGGRKLHASIQQVSEGVNAS